jgi:hypothetical protein
MSIWKSAAPVSLVLLCLAIPATSETQQPPESKWFEFKPGGLRGAAGGYALVYGIRNTSREPQWAMVEFDNPDGDRLCEFIKKIEPGAAIDFECPVAAVTAGQSYQLTLAVYEDERLTDRMVRFEPVLKVTEPELAEADKAGAASPAASRALVTTLDEGAATPFPATFKPTWYRRVERGFSLRAYEDSGDLTVHADALVFTAGKKTIRIPVSQITSVRLDSLPRDIANHWVVVRFTNDEQKPDGVGFRDGARMGGGQDTRLIYMAVRRAAKK